MLIATQDGSTLIVAAADTVVVLEAFYRGLEAAPAGAVRRYQPDVGEMLGDPRFARLRKPPYVFDFADPDGLRHFVAAHAIRLVPLVALVGMQREMLAALADDPYLNGDTRLIEEVHGLAKHDPWDTRTEAEKQQDEQHKKAAETAKQAGKLSSDSFAPSPRREKRQPAEDLARVTDIRSTRHADGSVTIDDVLAVKGLHDAGPAAAPDLAEPEQRRFRIQLLGETNGDVDDWLDVTGDLPQTASVAQRDTVIKAEGTSVLGHWFVLDDAQITQRLLGLLLYSSENRFDASVTDIAGKVLEACVFDPALAQQIGPGGWVAIYYRVDVMGVALTHVIAAIRRASTRQQGAGPQGDGGQQDDLLTGFVAARGQLADRSWLACTTRQGAETLAARLAADPVCQDQDIEVYAVNDLGERLMPKGIEIVTDTPAVEPPRPWNDGAGTWDNLDAEARRQSGIRLLGKEFIFCGSYRGAAEGCILVITPRSYFNRIGAIWEGALEITLPSDLKPLGGGVYRTRSRDWINLSQDLSGRGMIESLALQLYVNNAED